MAFHYHYFRTRGVYANIGAFQKVLAEAMSKEVVPMIASYAYETVEGWLEPPVFEQFLTVDRDGIEAGVVPTGPGAQKWNWIDRGVKGRRQRVARPARAGYKPAIRFHRYYPFTTPGWKFGGAGVASGRAVFVSGVRGYWWPGIAPRNFTGYILEKSRPEFRRLMENALRRAVRAAQREGS